MSYLHIYKKIYIKNFLGTDADGWTTGTYAFLVYHVVVFLGITLTTNHLGDLTLTIGANIFWSLFGFSHKAYAILFTNKHLNVDQLTRFMIAHYVVAWYYSYLVQSHVMYIHEMWDMDSGASAPQDGSAPKMSWGLDAAQRESLMMIGLYLGLMTFFCRRHREGARTIDFSHFEQWAEVEVEDPNFFIVGPHWYFRPHMGLLIVCAQHYEGLFWLIAFYALLASLPHLARLAQPTTAWGAARTDGIAMKESSTQQGAYITFVASTWYVGGTLPCARFYYEGDEGFFGNTFLKLSFQFIYAYLALVLHWLDRVERSVVSIRSSKPGYNLRRRRRRSLDRPMRSLEGLDVVEDIGCASSQP